VLTALAGLGLVAMVNRVGATPPMVDRLTIENASEFAFNVDVTGSSRGGSLDVGRVDRGSTIVVEKVIDQGDPWVFHFSGQGQDGGALSVDRQQLARQGWRLTIPDSAVQRLRAAGAPPTP
jgi:hypothetical protein